MCSLISRTLFVTFGNHAIKYPISFPVFSIGVNWKHWVLIGVPKWATYLGTLKNSYIKIIDKTEKDDEYLKIKQSILQKVSLGSTLINLEKCLKTELNILWDSRNGFYPGQLKTLGN